MSVQHSTIVWKYSRARLADRLVLLAIADFCDEHGQAWPSVGTLCDRCGLSDRAVQASLKELVKMGEIEIRPNMGPRGVNFYVMKLVKTPEEITGYPEKVSPQTPEKSVADPRNLQQGPPNSTTGTPEKFSPNPSRTTKDPSKNRCEDVPIVWPVELQTDAFRASWDDWVGYRRERKLGTYTNRGTNAQFKRLVREFGHDRAIAAIENSIAQNYQGIYEDKNRGTAHAANGHQATSAHNALSLNRTAASSYRQIGEKLRMGVAGNGSGGSPGAGGTTEHAP